VEKWRLHVSNDGTMVLCNEENLRRISYMNQILCKVSEEEARKLYDTIVEVEASKELYDTSMRQMDIQPLAIKVVLDYYINALKVHKAYWRDILVKYLGDDTASELNRILRYDPVKKVIFKLEIEGCSLCK
jgi:hypothetical protein